MTFVNVVNAVVILGMVMLWARNVNEIAIAWTVGDVCNTVLFFSAALFALREVGWRWDNLGGTQAESAVAPIPLSHRPTGGLPALNLLITIAEQQQEARIYFPRRNPLTDSHGLFTVMAFQAAERQRAESLKRANPALADSHARRAPQAPRPPSRSDPQHEQAFDVLFKMAERQRAAGLIDPYHPEPRGGQHPYAED
jgi:hypothetical protein